MPKKFTSENPKAAAVRERKQAVKNAEQLRRQHQIETEYWNDDDKQLKKKQQRKEVQEKKREEQLSRKAQANQQLEDEMNTLKSTNGQNSSTKITRAQIQTTNRKIAERKTASEIGAQKNCTIVNNIPLIENRNRKSSNVEEARNVDDAIQLLDSALGTTMSQQLGDRHPEKRMKAAYCAFEEQRLVEMKQTHPTLRLTQLKQLIYKEWLKSPANPINNS